MASPKSAIQQAAVLQSTLCNCFSFPDQLHTAPQLPNNKIAVIMGAMPGNAYVFVMIMDMAFNSAKPNELEYVSAEENVERVMGVEVSPFSPQVSISSHRGMSPRVYQSFHRRRLDAFGDSDSCQLLLKYEQSLLRSLQRLTLRLTYSWENRKYLTHIASDSSVWPRIIKKRIKICMPTVAACFKSLRGLAKLCIVSHFF